MEYCRVRMKDGILTAFSEEKKEQLFPGKLLMIILGAGTSISQEAVIFCGQHNCHLAVGRGGCYIHSYWMSGRWSDPRFLVNQVKVYDDPEKRLDYSKKLLKYRLKRENSNENEIIEIENTKNINELLAREAVWAKKIYRLYRTIYNVNFKRDIHSRQGINSKITLLNNALYSLTTSIILNMGMSPSVGLLHGQTRRGGFAFDLADIFKSPLTLDLAFKYRDKDYRYVMSKLSLLLKQNNYEIIKEMIYICYWLRGDILDIC